MNANSKIKSTTLSARSMRRLIAKLKPHSRRRRVRPASKARSDADNAEVLSDHVNKLKKLYDRYPELLSEVCVSEMEV